MERVEKTFLDFMWETRKTDPGFIAEIEKRYDKWYIESDPYKLAAKKILGLGIFSTPKAHGRTDEQAMTAALEIIARTINETIPPSVVPDIDKGAAHLKGLISDANKTYSEPELIESLLKFWGFPNIS